MAENLGLPFGDVVNMTGSIGRGIAGQYFNQINTDGIGSKIFSPQIRSYFDLDTETVKRKLIKLLFPFKTYDWDDNKEVKKLDLYIPTVSFMTLIMFSTILQGIQQEVFEPKMSRKITWIIIFSFIEILLARCTDNVISSMNISFLQLTALVSYRFVPIAVIILQLVLTSNTIPYLNFLGVIYILVVDIYYCKVQLSNYAKEKFVEQGIGAKIGLCVHFINTIAIIWLCNLL